MRRRPIRPARCRPATKRSSRWPAPSPRATRPISSTARSPARAGSAGTGQGAPMRALTDEMLPVGDGHEICLRTYGTPGRVPVLFLHGGPGSGVQDSHLSLFDPATCHLVAFDQRGAGLSLPKRSRHANTTQHLIADIEAIRAHLGLSEWMVVGGSWGATLALAYAEAHPDRVLGLVLRATFLGTRAELDWAFLTGPGHLHPALHADFLSMLPEDERGDPLPA